MVITSTHLWIYWFSYKIPLHSNVPSVWLLHGIIPVDKKEVLPFRNHSHSAQFIMCVFISCYGLHMQGLGTPWCGFWVTFFSWRKNKHFDCSGNFNINVSGLESCARLDWLAPLTHSSSPVCWPIISVLWNDGMSIAHMHLITCACRFLFTIAIDVLYLE